MNTQTLRRSALCLALLLALSLGLAGCQPSGNTAGNGSGAVKLDNVYKAEYMTLPEGLDDAYRCEVRGDRVYLFGYETQEVYRPVLMSMNPDGSDTRTIPLPLPETNGEKGGNTYVNQLTIAPDETVWYIEYSYSYDDSDPENIVSTEKNILKHIDAAGQELFSMDLNDLKDPDMEYFYVGSMAVDGQGNVYLSSEKKLFVLNANGSRMFDIPLETYINGMVLGSEGNIVAQISGDKGTTLREIDLATKSFGREQLLETGTYFTILPGRGYSLLLDDRDSVYGFDMATGTKTKLLNWIDSDVDVNQINSIAQIAQDKLICLGYSAVDYKGEITLLTKVDASSVPERKIITLGTGYLSYEMRRAVIQFNKANEAYRIQVRDYSTYNTMDNGQAGLQRLNTEIISGNVPDILVIDNTMPYGSYVSKGLFKDLYALMDADESFNRADYLQEVMKIFESNGKLYSLVPQFSIYTVAGKTSDVGTDFSWTMDELIALLASKPEGTQVFSDVTKASFLQYAIQMSMDTYVNRATGQCNFDSPGFIKILEFAKNFPDEISYDDGGTMPALRSTVSAKQNLMIASGDIAGGDIDWQEYNRRQESQYREGRTLLSMAWLSDFSYYHTLRAVNFAEDITLVGFPNDLGVGSAIVPNLQLAISAKTKNADGAWQFIKLFLSDEYYENNYYAGFPLKLSHLQKHAERAMTPYTYQDENGNTVEMPNTYWFNDEEVDIGYPTQDEVDIVMNLIRSVTNVYTLDESLMSIIQDETGPYFAGQKSAAETAQIIQSRVQIYISENR